ncbi:MAG TPA: hypothetical protein DCE17_00610 [Lactobacillus sp.]|uniref:protein-export chaperone SecB n=1 Tax=Ligilactobacillus murinus TaxID=1622 RepID=UPI0009FB6948|nr:protein-export chaperone SecB [Ligilactobacillus murinus]HAB48916.1 hypothetical protein [Lactobacillus sp.]
MEVASFQGYSIRDIKYHKSLKNLENTLSDKDMLEVSSEINVTPDMKQAKLQLKVLCHAPNAEMNLELWGYFTLTTKLERNEITDYLGLNGVALLLPYARSIISIVSVLDGKDALLMPTVDVLGLLKSTETFEDDKKT